MQYPIWMARGYAAFTANETGSQVDSWAGHLEGLRSARGGSESGWAATSKHGPAKPHGGSLEKLNDASLADRGISLVRWAVEGMNFLSCLIFRTSSRIC